jgi:hypothetical protein
MLHAVAVLLLVAQGAWAAGEKLPQVAVVGLHVPGATEEQARAVTDSLVVELNRTGLVTAIGPSDVARRIAGREPLVVNGIFLGPGRKLLDEGRVLMQRAATDQAIPILEDAVAALRDGLGPSTDSRPLIDALVLLGVAHQTLGDADGALRAFSEVVHLDPGLELDEVNYPPRMVEAFRAAREAVVAQGSGTISVSTPTSGVRVFIDGREVGQAPVSLSGVPVGNHYVLAIGGQGHRTVETVHVTAGETAEVQAALDRRAIAEPGDSARERSRKVRDLYRSLGAYIDTDLVLVGGVTADQAFAVQLYATRAGSFSKILSGEAGPDPNGAAVAFVASLATFATATGDLRADEVGVQVLSLDIDANPVLADLLFDPDADLHVGHEKSKVRWLVWAGAGALVAGGGTGLALALTSGDQQAGNHGTIVFGPIP